MAIKRRKTFLPLAEAKALLAAHDVGSKTQYLAALKAGRLAGLPALAAEVYADDGWSGWGDYLGTGRRKSNEVAAETYLPFADARDYVRALGLTDEDAFAAWAASEARPPTIPRKPRRYYAARGWVSMGDFIGAGRNRANDWMLYDEACALVRAEGVASAAEFRDWASSDKRPHRLPSHPAEAYRGKGWKGWPEFFGVRRNLSYGELRIAHVFESCGVEFRHEATFEGCRDKGKLPVDFAVYRDGALVAIVEHHGVQHFQPVERFGGAEALARTRRRDLKKNVLAHELGVPYVVSLEDDLKDVVGFLERELGPLLPNVDWSRGRAAGLPTLARFRSYEEARAAASVQGFKNQNEYKAWDRPDGMPADPASAYRLHGWLGWGDFLGTGNIAVTQKPFVDYAAAKAWFIAAGVRSEYHWRTIRKDKPDFIPSNPNATYKGKGWKGWTKFLDPEEDDSQAVTCLSS